MLNRAACFQAVRSPPTKDEELPRVLRPFESSALYVTQFGLELIPKILGRVTPVPLPWFSADDAEEAQVGSSGGNNGLAQRKSPIVGRNLGMQEDFKPLGAQLGHAPAEKKHVLKCAAAQANAIQPVRSPEP